MKEVNCVVPKLQIVTIEFRACEDQFHLVILLVNDTTNTKLTLYQNGLFFPISIHLLCFFYLMRLYQLEEVHISMYHVHTLIEIKFNMIPT